MHSRGRKLAILKRHVQNRTAATATKQVGHTHLFLLYWSKLQNLKLERAPSQWESPTPASAVSSFGPQTLSKWAPPLSKWVKSPPAPTAVSANLVWNAPLNTDTSERPPSARLYVTRGAKKPSTSNYFAGPSSSSINRGKPEDSSSSSLGKWKRANPPPPMITTKPDTSTPASFGSSGSSFSRDQAPHTVRTPSQDLKLQEPTRSEAEPLEFSRNAPSKVSSDVEAANRRRGGDAKFKQRGSLLSRLNNEDVSIPHRPRVHDLRTSFKPKVQRSTRQVKINPDIHIPSVVSVGNLARLLNIRLGGFCLAVRWVLLILYIIRTFAPCNGASWDAG